MALEVVGGAFLSSLFNVMFERLASREFMDFLGKKKPITELLEKMKILLLSANAVLNDAENKQIRDENVYNWVDALNDVLQKAYDVIDEINFEALRYERCQIEGSHQPRCSIGNMISDKLINPLPSDAFDRAIEPKLEDVLEKLKFVLEQKGRLGLSEGVQSKRLETSLVPLIGDPSEVYGRDSDKEAIVELVVSENKGDEISIIPIVGMGGIGKTTLARLIYDDIRVKDHFKHRAWVTVSHDFDVRRLARLVFKELTSKEPITDEVGKLRDNLKEELSGDKFFLVLDNVWNKSYGMWNEFMSYLQYEANGCKIIVTNHDEDIASMMGSVPLHSLTALSDENCLRLLNKYVSYNINSGVNQCLTMFGQKIVKKCKGLPLSVMLLAGLLRSLSETKDWKEILDSEIWDLQKNGDYEILPSLWLSYSYLPSYLKRCFAYCAIFPKDYEYKKEEIILLWMAEGLLIGENMEEVGEEYLKILISRSLLQRSSKDDSILLMHDLVHDLALFVTGKGYCAKLEDVSVKSITIKTRRVLFENYFSDTENFDDFSKAECLHTFLCLAQKKYLGLFYNFNADALIKKFGSLRVISPFPNTILEVPDSIGNLKHLRYLDLSWNMIKRLPDSICTLYNLQTLLLRDCHLLTQLPGNIDRLINLRHLDISETSLKTMPPCFFDMKSLQITLSRFVLIDKKSGSRIKELRKRFRSHGMLEILGLENVVDVNDVLEVELKNKSHITELSLTWTYWHVIDSQKEREVLDALQPHHANLKTLRITDYKGKQLSDWVADLSFSNTTEVFLSFCTECRYLPPFGQLPSLEKLEIVGCYSIETISSEFYGSKTSIPFRALKYLRIWFMNKWRSWSLNEGNESEFGAFPCLEVLKIESCPMLNSPLPHCFPSLKKLVIDGCLKTKGLLPSGQLMNTAFPLVESIELIDCPVLELTGLPFPSNLSNLSFSYNCEKPLAPRGAWGVQALKHLTLELECLALFPEEGLLPATLISLWIKGARRLKALNGKGLQHLTFLEELHIYYCPKLACLPEQGLPACLSDISVINCPLLKPRLERDKGEDWHKISHIPNKYVDGCYIG